MGEIKAVGVAVEVSIRVWVGFAFVGSEFGVGRGTTPSVNLVCCRTMRFDGARVITHDGIVDGRGCNAVSDGRGDGGYGAD